LDGDSVIISVASQQLVSLRFHAERIYASPCV
jgi:hypothetical protein